MQTWQAELLLNVQCELGEGPMWHPTEQKLYWVDILSKRLYRYDLETKQCEIHDFPIHISALAPLEKGGLIIGTEESILKYDFDQRISIELTQLEDHMPGNRTNDGKCCPLGCFWVGTMSKKATPNYGTLYVLDHDLSIDLKIENTTISNGMTWSMDERTMYYIDSPDKCVYAYDYSPKTGSIGNKRTVIDFSDLPEVPDGMTIDTEGMLWIAHFDGLKVGRWDPETGKMIGQVELPVPKVTSCCFGGPEMDTLFITTAWEYMNEAERAQYPHSGDLFRVKLPFRGRAAYFYKGRV